MILGDELDSASAGLVICLLEGHFPARRHVLAHLGTAAGQGRQEAYLNRILSQSSLGHDQCHTDDQDGYE